MDQWKQKISAFWKEQLRFHLRMVWDIFWEARRAFTLDGCMNLSAALAFYTILSLIPFLFLIISAAGFILGSSDEAHQMALSFFDRLFPQASASIFKEVKAISERAEVLGWVGILSMIWTASVVFSSLEYAMGVVFRVEKRRNLLKSRLLALTMFPAAGALFILSILVTAFSGVLHSEFFLKFILGYLFPYLILAFAFTAIYKIIPNTPIAFRHALAGGTSCAFLFELAKHFFTWYISRSSQYNIVYGSLEAIIILVVWTFYSSSILLFCAEVVSAYRRRDITLLEKAFI
ncbi:MAG: YihY/virulence factor BrkB family protein [Thermodesulfobacteriota bacterium]|jgi:membrane protein